MTGMPEGVRKVCVAYDVANYSGRGTRREYATQRRLAELLELALRTAGLEPGSYEMQEQGDGGIALLPTGGAVDEPRMLVTLVRSLETGLTELNEDLVPQARIRLRVGLQEGVVHLAPHGYVGTAVIGACRLRDAGPVRDALRANADAVLVVAVADGLYADVLAHGHHGLPGSAFSRAEVRVKEFAASAWIYVAPAGPGPGGPGGSGGPAGQPPVTSAGPLAPDVDEPEPGAALGRLLASDLDTW